MNILFFLLLFILSSCSTLQGTLKLSNNETFQFSSHNFLINKDVSFVRDGKKVSIVYGSKTQEQHFLDFLSQLGPILSQLAPFLAAKAVPIP